MKVTVDQDKCGSSRQCVLNAMEVFDQRDEDGVVELLEGHARCGIGGDDTGRDEG